MFKWGHRVGLWSDRTSVLIKSYPRVLILSLFLSTHLEKGMWGQQQGAIYKSGNEASAGTSAQSLSLVPFSVIPWTAVCQASLSVTNSRSLLKLMSIKSVMPSNHLLLCHPLHLSPSVFPNIGVFSNESVLQRADRMKTIAEGNGKPPQYSCLENPMNGTAGT